MKKLLTLIFLIPICMNAQTLQDLFGPTKNIFLLVSAEQLFTASDGSGLVTIENYCALQDNAGIMKYGSEIKDEKEGAFRVDPGDELTWSGKVDPASRDKYTISLLEIVITQVMGENLFQQSYLPGSNKKVVANVRTDVPGGSMVRYNIFFSLEERKENGITKYFVLDPFLLVNN